MNSIRSAVVRFVFRSTAVAVLLAAGVSNARSAGRDIYPDVSLAKGELAAALRTAAQTHKRVLIDFGGNWCGDCKVLDIYLHNARNEPMLEANYVLVDVNIGSNKMEANNDIARHYQVPLDQGVPALAVLDEHGKLLYSMKTGEFESMRKMDPSSVTAFLAQWKAARPGCSAVMTNC